MYDGATPIYMAAFFGHLQITELLMEARTSLDLEHENGYTPLMISAYNGHRVVATLLLAARSKIHIDAVELDTAIIGGVGIEKLPGSCKGRLGVWLHEDFQCNPEDEEEEKEEDSMWRMINVEEDEDSCSVTFFCPRL
jgi:ankyrin repeat protein